MYGSNIYEKNYLVTFFLHNCKYWRENGGTIRTEAALVIQVWKE